MRGFLYKFQVSLMTELSVLWPHYKQT